MKKTEYLLALIDQPLCYGEKSPDMELYVFGFGRLIKRENLKGQLQEVGSYRLHVICRFKVIWRNGEHRVDIYTEDTSAEAFREGISPLIGARVKRVALSDKNDLWLDLGDWWIVFATFEGEEESWRFFTADRDASHLVASDSALSFPGDKGTVCVNPFEK